MRIRALLIPASAVLTFSTVLVSVLAQSQTGASAGEGLDVFESRTLHITNPIPPYVFPTGEISVGQDTRPELFDETRAGQTAEAMNLALRNMVSAGKSEAEIRTVLDKMARWARAVEALRQQYRYRGGLTGLEALASQSKDIRVLARAAMRWVEAVELERANILALIFSPASRDDLNDLTHIRVDPKTNQWTFPYRTYPDRPSTAFAKAAAAVNRALAVDAADAEAELAAAWLRQWQLGLDKADVIQAAKRAAAGKGPEAVVAAFLVLQLDNNGPYELQLRAKSLRSVQRGPSRITQGLDQEVRVAAYSPGITLNPGERIKGNDVVASVPSVVEEPGPIIHTPTAQDLAQADALDAEAARLRVRMRAEANNLLLRNPLNAPLFRTAARFYGNGVTQQRILQYALFLDPGDYRLYWQNAIELDRGNRTDIGEASAYAQWYFRTGQVFDIDSCNHLATGLYEKYKDPFANNSVARYCARLAPTHPGGHLQTVYSYAGLRRKNFLMTEVANALEEGLAEAEVAYQVAARLREHREEWPPTMDLKIVTNNMAIAQVWAGTNLEALGRKPEAIAHYQRAIQLAPDMKAAQTSLQRLTPRAR